MSGLMQVPTGLGDLSSWLAAMGFALLAANCLLSGRFRWLTGLWSIDSVMRTHQWLGRLALAIFLAHPILYFDVPETMSAIGYGWGILALIFLVALVMTALSRDEQGYRYEAWRMSHGLLSLLVMVLGYGHILGSSGLVKRAPDLSLALLLCVLIASGSLIWAYVGRPIMLAGRRFEVRSLACVADRTWSLTLSQQSGPVFSFRAGQFVWLRAKSPWNTVDHPFSLASEPRADGTIEFLVKEAGDFTRALQQELPIGSPVYLDGPYGNFTLPVQSFAPAGLLFIAGGIGLAPLLSILRSIYSQEVPEQSLLACPVVLVVGNRHEGQLLAQAELKAFSRRGLVVHQVVSEPSREWTGLVGQMDEQVLAPLLPSDPRGWQVYVCGPGPMMDGVTRLLKSRGFRAAKIHSERFRT